MLRSLRLGMVGTAETVETGFAAAARRVRWAQVSARRLAMRCVEPMVIAAIMFLLTRAEILLRASPLAVAGLCAVAVSGRSAAAAVVGCMLGAFRLPLSDVSLMPVIGCALALGGEFVLSLIPAAEKIEAETRVSAVAGFACLLPAVVRACGALLPSVQAAACGVLAAAAAPFMLEIVSLSEIPEAPTPACRAGAAVVLGGVLAGMYALLPPFGSAAAALLALILPGGGLLCGLALTAGGAELCAAAALAMMSAAARCKLLRGRIWRAAAALGAAGLAYALAGAAALDLWAAAAAAVGYALLPDAALRRIESLAAPSGDAANRLKRSVSRRLNALGGVFRQLSSALPGANPAPDEQALIQQMRARLCAGCSSYEGCWAGGDNRAVRLLCRLIEEALERVNAPSGMRVLFSDGEIPPDVLRVCRRGRMIPDRLGLMLRDFCEKRRAGVKRCADERMLSAQFGQAAQLLQEMARAENDEIPRAPRFAAETAVSCQSGLPGSACGDSYLIRPVSGGRLMLLLSDGMGMGEAAAQESRAAAELIGGMLGAGLPRELAQETVNQYLLWRSGEDLFATLDLCLLDLHSGVAEFSKMAACQTVILRGGTLLRVEGADLPLGVVEGAHAGCSRVQLRPGDMLIMATDGVMEAGGGDFIADALTGAEVVSPRQLAARLVHEAAARRAGGRADDLTCLCARICSARRRKAG